MEIERPTYFSITPAEVRYDEELSPYAKLLYGEFTCLSTKEGYCFASNNYFAELYKVTPQAVSKWIKSLERKGYIRIQYIYNGKEIKERRIYINTAMVSTMVDRGINVGLKGYQPTIKDNNTRNNNTRNNNSANARPENKKEISDSQKLKKIYLDNYHELYREGCVYKENPVINWGVAIHNLNEAVEKFGYADIEKAIIKSKNDDFCIKNGYALTTILSYGVLSGLINSTGKGANKHYGTSLCSQTCDVVTDEDLKNIRF